MGVALDEVTFAEITTRMTELLSSGILVALIASVVAIGLVFRLAMAIHRFIS